MRLDGISLAILHSRLISIVDESAATLVRTAYSHIIRDAKDFAVGLLDSEGHTLSQSTESIPVFLGTMSRTARALLEQTQPVGPGDIVVTNDPWLGSGHLPDVNMLMPVYDGDALLGYVVVIAHMADIGGRILGTDANELFEEGLQIPVMKLYEGGRRNDALLQLVRANVRVPEQVAGDLDAMVAAGHVAARRLLDLAGELRSTDFTSVAQALQERGEQAMREAIGNLATGTYGGELLVEGADVPLMVAVRIDVDAAAGEISLDYAGTTPQVSTGHNATAGYTSAYTAYALKCLLAPDLPFTEGIFTPLTVNVPEGSVLGCRRPAAVGGRHLVGQSTTSLVIRVMAEAIPELAVADCGSPRPFITVAGRQADGAPFSLPILAMGGFGARAGSDGPPTMPFPSNTEAVPIETLEATTPLHLEEKELLCDSGGAGRRRGGLGQRFRARALVDGINVSVIATRTRYPAEGLFGGGSGGLARIAVRSGATGEERTLASVARLMTGDELVIESPGGGGYGSPVERDPAALEADVAGGYVSADAAAACYGR